MIDTERIDRLHSTTIGPEHKSFPARSWGMTVDEFLESSPRLSDLHTPIATLDARALDANQSVMTGWVRGLGVEIAPHGKTTMSPQLWRRQLDAGAWAVTVATGWQAQLARQFGVRRILVANEVVDPIALSWIHDELERDQEFEIYCWADSPQTVQTMTSVLDGGRESRINVLIDVGTGGGRTGARDRATAMSTARAVAASPHLRLAGVAGWEGVLGHDRTPETTDRLHRYADELAAVHREIRGAGLYDGPTVLTAGGSAFPDIVAEHLTPLIDESTSVVIRSGCYITHDDGMYAELSPLRANRTDRPLRSALHVWARTLSRPEPGLAILDAGRRDMSFDAGLPVPQQLSTGESVGGDITALNDQHAFYAVPADNESITVGTVVRLGVSHPCTTFDKWRLIPVIEGADTPDPRVVDVIHTFF
ncbi:D-serine deaminase-like pyridoxal phosphate-dependent protein [Rhodococcus sp. 27YEA15]|uniref:alanine racemase n=1 Tax=Rhodococcus sp. 27YEA15 TaxID=3156259 RepID=UPI003C7D6CBE